jgi:hypothetical protein
MVRLIGYCCNKQKKKRGFFVNTIRWIRLIFSSVFILLGLIFGTYFYIKEHPLTSVAPQGCIVRILQKRHYDYSFWQARMTTIAITIPQNLQQLAIKCASTSAFKAPIG